MYKLDREPFIEVSSPAHSEGQDGQTSTFTGYFRVGWYLTEALEAAIARKGSADVSFRSAPSSIGTELDNFLAEYNAAGHTGRVEARGYDANPAAVAAAIQGRHTVIGRPHTGVQDRYAAALRRFGFGVELLPEPEGSDEAPDGDKQPLLIADAGPVRAGHSVDFEERNILEPLPEGEADLIMATNFLYYLDDEEEARAVRSLGGGLADHGVLNLGLHVREPTRRQLEQEFDLMPIFSPYGELHPVLFGRV